MTRLQEKPHIIDKLVNLTPEQKQAAKQFFATHRNLENQIDWNRGQKLTWEDFARVIQANANTFKNKMKAMKKAAPIQFAGLKEGEDYARVDTGNPQFIAVVPFNHEASRILASKGSGGTCEGKWCIAYQKHTKYWDDYTGRGDTFMFVMIPTMEEKFAFQINHGQIDVWTPEDSHITLAEFVAICGQDEDISPPIQASTVKRWCEEAEREAEGHLERGPIYTSVDTSWRASVQHGNARILELSYYVQERRAFEDGDDEFDEGFGSDIKMMKVNKNTITSEMMKDAKGAGFDLIHGHGLLFSLPDNTMTPEQADGKAYNMYDSDWDDIYDDDAVHEIGAFLGITEGYQITAKYALDYLVFDTNATLEGLEDDDVLFDLLEQVLHFTIPRRAWDAVQGDHFTYIIVNANYRGSEGTNPNDFVERPDGPVWYDDPQQQQLKYEAQRLRALRMLLGEGAPFYPTN